MNYKIIQDEAELRKFIDMLPETTPDEKYYISLFARKKYAEGYELSSDKGQLKRVLAKKDQIIDKIWQMETPIGSYKYDDKLVPQEAIAVYINPNPRSMRKAASILVRKVVEIIDYGYSRYNVVEEALSAVQQSRSKTHFIDFDFNVKSLYTMEDCFSEIRSYINPHECKVVLTREGFHLLVMKDLVDQDNKIWYNSISAMQHCDINGDFMIPVPGCYQGGYTPRIISL